MVRFFFVILVFLFCANKCYTQCCAQGCSMTSSNIFDVLEKHHLELTGFLKHSNSNQYYNGSSKYYFTNAPLSLKNTSFDYFGMSIGYGITNKLSVEAQGGYFGNKTQNFIDGAWLVGNGLSDWEVNLKYNFYNSSDSTWSMTISPGCKLPLGNYKDYTPQGVKLSRDVQSGTGAFAGNIEYACLLRLKKGINVVGAVEYEYNGINPEQYQYGDKLTITISSKLKLYKSLSLVAMLKNESTSNDYFYDQEIVASGYNKLTLIPALSVDFKRDWSFTIIPEIPVYQHFNNIQFAQQYTVSCALSKDLNLKKLTHHSTPEWHK